MLIGSSIMRLIKKVKKTWEFGGMFTFISCRCAVTCSYSRHPSSELIAPEVSNCTKALPVIETVSVMETDLAKKITESEAVNFYGRISLGSDS